jgi:hypothetical protein
MVPAQVTKKEFFCIQLTWNIAKGSCPSKKKRLFFAYKEPGSLDTGPSQEKQEFFSLPTCRFPYLQGYLANPKLHTQGSDKSYHICWLRVLNLIPHFEEYSLVLL